MKTLAKMLLLVLTIGFFACKDTKKEKEVTEEVVNEIESVESEIDSVDEEIEADAKALEEALKELDSI